MRRPTGLRISIAALVTGLAMLMPGRAQSEEEKQTGVYLAAAATLSLHKDVVGVGGTYSQDGYIDLGLALRLGAAIRGVVLGVGVERAMMIETAGAEYAALFGGYGVQLPRAWALELTGEVGVHGFENVGSAGGNDVTSENHVTLPFLGARLTALRHKRPRIWQPAFFFQVRRDLGQQSVTSERVSNCDHFFSSFPDQSACDTGVASTGLFEVGGFSAESGFEIRRIF